MEDIFEGNGAGRNPGRKGADGTYSTSWNWKKQLADLIKKPENLRTVRGDRRASDRTQEARSKILFLGFEELKLLGYRFETIHSFRQKHMQALVNKWLDEGKSASTIQNRLTAFRIFASWIGKTDLIGPTEDFVKEDPEAAKRTLSAQVDKSWSGNGVDIDQKLAQIRAADERAGLMLLAGRTWGLRRLEMVCIRPYATIVQGGVTNIDAFQDEQLHEVRQTAVLTQDNDAHRANGPIEMPAELFVEAVNLAEKIPFDEESEFAKSVANVPGGLERHPAMKLLCDWWESVRPEGEPFRPGSAMPIVRVRDDGQYWWGDHQVPNSPVVDFNPTGRDVARIGDVLLVLFQATQDAAVFDKDGMTVFLPSGERFSTIEIDRAQYLSGESDEAWACLSALASFRSRFFSAWRFLSGVGAEYRMAERAKVARPIALPDGFKPCATCGGLPEITEDPTGKYGRRFLLKCGDHASIGGDSLEDIFLDWECDYEDMEETR